MAGQSFDKQIVARIERIRKARLVVMQESAQRIINLAQTPVSAGGNLPVDLGFLRGSITASVEVPAATRTRPPGKAAFSYDGGAISLAIAGWKASGPLFITYTANYARHVHWGARGRPGRPWVTLAAQQFPRIVREVAQEVRASGAFQ
tara:strand:+ start:6441 stop:6884 length:444 start_codon:yes stop_codon:yes gene_type:complete